MRRLERLAGCAWLNLDGVVQPLRVHRCDHFLARLRGRLMASSENRHDVWCLQPCNAVHTFMLPQAIDVVFCDGDGRVLRVCAAMRPWRVTRCSSAHSVWEFSAGEAARWQIAPGNLLRCGSVA